MSTAHAAKKVSPKRKKMEEETKTQEKTPPKKQKKGNAEQAEQRGEGRVSEHVMNSLIHDKCDEVKALGEIYTVQCDDKIIDVWETMITKGYSSAPVVTAGNYLHAIIDVLDIARYFVEWLGLPMVGPGRWLPDIVADIKQEMAIWCNDLTVRELLDFPLNRTRRIMTVTYKGWSLLSALEMLARMKGIHRCAVVEAPLNNKLVSFLTQTQVLEYINENLHSFGSRKWKKIEECVDVVKPRGVFAVTPDTYVLNAYQHMLRHDVSAVCVVKSAEDSTMVDCVSVEHMKILKRDLSELKLLYGQTSAWLGHVKDAFPHKKDEKPLLKWGCRKGDTLAKVVKHMFSEKVKHVFLLDAKDTPIGVVTVREILLELIS